MPDILPKMNNSDTETEQPSLPPDVVSRRHPGPNETRPLKVRRIPLWHGWYWLIEGFTLWGRNPAFLSFLTFSFILAIIMASMLPYVGELLSSILYPGLMLGVFNGCRAIDRKRKLTPILLISGFRRYAYDLLLAGFCHFIVMNAVLLSTRLIDGGIMWRLLTAADIPDSAILSSTPFRSSLIFTSILFVLWGMVCLFVPQLIGWWRLSVPKALGFSLKGCLLNSLPLFTYGFCFSFFIIILAALVINFFELTAEGLGIVACVVFLLIAIPSLIASFYVAARDIFGFPRRRRRRRPHPDPAQPERSGTRKPQA
ncbi:MAG: hypothetical protein LBU76_10570 [Azoarcus sp.]|jgi:hypothetical protein|nr:hypothetical protein [Azoarcus sp.]